MSETTSLEARIQRLEDIDAIHNLMGRRAYLHSAGLNDRELAECWSVERADIAFEAEDWGVWDGREAISAAYVKDNPFPADTKGLLIEHTLTTAVLEVAADGQTAKGVWISPGHETFPIVDGELPKPHWSWGRYAVDFVRESTGEWRIWHLHVLTTFRTPFGQDWVDSAVNRPPHLPEAGETMPGMTPPTRGVTFNQPYHPKLAPAYEPVPPAPYRDWSEVSSYTDPRD